MLVVGTRGLGRVRSLLVGSVSGAVARHAPCPAVVVRDTGAAARPAGVVVGVADGPVEVPSGSRYGSAPEVDAVLALAFEVSEARSLPLTVLHCSWADPDVGPDLERVQEAVARHGTAHPQVTVRVETARGYADEHLVRASGDAALVVVGRRHQPFLGELVYGSVAPVVVEHAQCSVAVVPVGARPL
jgi:nucleotide-binding universal stress UspA family protein